VQHRNDQLQRQLHEGMRLRNLHRRRRHGRLRDQLCVVMHDDRWTDDVFGLLQRAMWWGLHSSRQLRSIFFRRLPNGLLGSVFVQLQHGAGHHKLRDRLRDKLPGH
jgi:hypothetical protein